MNKVLIVVRKEYLERVRAKSFIIMTVLGPVLMSMFIVVPLLLEELGGAERRTIGVVDPAGVFVGPIQEALDDNGADFISLVPISVEGRPVEEGIDEVKEMILSGAVSAGVLIDPDFVESRRVIYYNNSVTALVARDDVLHPALSRVLRERRFAAKGVADSLHSYLVARPEWTDVGITAAGEEERQQGDAVFAMAFTLIMILYFTVMAYGSQTLMAVIEEKSSRVVEVLLASIAPEKLMLGKVLGTGLAGLTQFAIWTTALAAVSVYGGSVGGLSLDAAFLTPIILGSFIIFFLLGFFLYATLYAGIGAMCNTAHDAQQFHLPLMMGLVIPIVLLTYIFHSPDAPVSVILSLVPIFAPMLMFIRICVQTPPLWQILLCLLLLGLSIWGAVQMAGRLFRMGILMHGTSPTWGTLLKALRSG